MLRTTVLLPVLVVAVLVLAVAAGAPGAVGGVRRCTASGLTARFARVRHSAGGGLVSYTLTIRSTSQARCRLAFSRVKLLGRQGQLLPTNGGPAMARDASSTVVLARGQTASQTAQFSSTYPGQGEPTTGPCEPTAYRLQIVLGASSQPLVAKLDPPTPVCSSGMLLFGGLSRAH